MNIYNGFILLYLNLYSFLHVQNQRNPKIESIYTNHKFTETFGYLKSHNVNMVYSQKKIFGNFLLRIFSHILPQNEIFTNGVKK